MKETIIFYVLILSNSNLNYNYPVRNLYYRAAVRPEISIFYLLSSIFFRLSSIVYLLKLIAFPEL